jgi:hypothetical protein
MFPLVLAKYDVRNVQNWCIKLLEHCWEIDLGS